MDVRSTGRLTALRRENDDAVSDIRCTNCNAATLLGDILDQVLRRPEELGHFLITPPGHGVCCARCRALI